jgi:hypothetical protein
LPADRPLQPNEMTPKEHADLKRKLQIHDERRHDMLALPAGRRGADAMTSKRIDYATISSIGTVSYCGVDASGNAFTATTYDTSERFNWRRLPKNTPVIDCRWDDVKTIWRALIKPEFSTLDERLAAARAAGIPVATAGGIGIIEDVKRVQRARMSPA